MADSRIIDIPVQNSYVPAYVEIDTGTASYRQSINTLVSSVVSAYLSGDQTQNTALGLNTDGTMPAITGSNYLDAETSHIDAILTLDTELAAVSSNVGNATYSNNYSVTDGDDHGVAIGKLDATCESLNSQINAISIAASETGATRVTVKVTPAILSAIYSGTPYNLIDLALGATGRYVVIHDVFVDVDYKSSAHAATGNLYITYSNTYSAANKIAEIASAAINATSDTSYHPVIESASGVARTIVDKDIYLVEDSGSLTAGYSVIYITILYSTISRDESIAPIE